MTKTTEPVLERMAELKSRISTDDWLTICDYVLGERELAASIHTHPAPSPDVAGLVELDEAFCDAVWQALKGDHNDLRRQAIILKAHRTTLATLSAENERLREALALKDQYFKGITKLAALGEKQ